MATIARPDDMLDGMLAALRGRIEELKPAVAEYERLEKADAALSQTPSEPEAPKRRGRPRSS